MGELIAENAAGGRRRALFDPACPLGNPGATGIVYKDQTRPGWVVKIYKDFVALPSLSPGTAKDSDMREASDKIVAMLAKPPDQQTAIQSGVEFTQIAWPQERLLTADGRFVGLSMREINFDQSAAIEDLFLQSRRAQMRLVHDYEFRLIAAQNLAALAHLIHARGHAIVDLQPQNMRIYRQNGWVGLLDCDGFRIAASKVYPARVLRADFAAPELQRANGNVRPDMGDQLQDRFGIALIIFHLLNDGLSPFNVSPRRTGKAIPSDLPGRMRDRLYGYGRQPHKDVAPASSSIHEHWPRELRDMFDLAFGPDPALRPTPLEWSTHVSALLAGARTCKAKPHHGKSVIGGKCMLCAREAMLDRARTSSARAPLQTSYTPSAPRSQISVPIASQPRPAQTTNNGCVATTLIAGGLAIAALVVVNALNGASTPTTTETPIAAPYAPPVNTTWVQTAPTQQLRNVVASNSPSAPAASIELTRRSAAALAAAHGNISALVHYIQDWSNESANSGAPEELRQLLAQRSVAIHTPIWPTVDADLREWPAARAPVLFSLQRGGGYAAVAQITNESIAWYALRENTGRLLYARAQDFASSPPFDTGGPSDLTPPTSGAGFNNDPTTGGTATYLNLTRAWVRQATPIQIERAYPSGRPRRESVSVDLDCLILKGGALDCAILGSDSADEPFRRAALNLTRYYQAPEYLNGAPTAEARTRMHFRFDPPAR